MKLTGKTYVDYWRTRMGAGAEQAAHGGKAVEEQGDFYFAQMLPFLPEAADQILEFGSGYGRMLKRLRTRFPGAFLIGVDLVITCTVLQHITDDDLLDAAALSLVRALRPGGAMVLLENVESPGAVHVRDMEVADYMRLFGDAVKWGVDIRDFEWMGELHALMSGVKQ
jgi:SAM-dependent methyltransferase